MLGSIRRFFLLAFVLTGTNAFAQTPSSPAPASSLSIESLFKPAAAAPANVDFTYTVSPELKKKVEGDYLANLAKTSPSASRQLAGQLERNDVGAIFARMVTPLGLKRGDLADTFTAYVVLNWSIINNDLSAQADEKQRVAAARAQVATFLAGQEQIKDPAVRAQMGAELELLFVTLQASWQAAAERRTLPPFSSSVADLFQQQMGVDFRKVEFTSKGLGLKP